MKLKTLCLFVLSCGFLAGTAESQSLLPVPAPSAIVTPSSPAPVTGFIVRDPLGLNSIQIICLIIRCNVAGSIDGNLGRLFLVTVPATIDPNAFLELLRSLPEITDAEINSLLTVLSAQAATPPSGLYDSTPVSYFGTSVWHGYVAQPAATIIRLADTQSAFNVSGSGIVADIDTGVDPNHPVLQPVLLSGYDFIRNQPGGSEMADYTGAPPPNSQDVAQVNQSTAAVLDQSTAAVLDGSPQYAAFGHGTMVAGVIHLVAPTAQIMPLKAFSADGSGYLSNVLQAAYYAVQNGASVINMSFSLPTYSEELDRAMKYAVRHGAICVASAGNDGKETRVYPAALDSVMGVASTANNDSLSSFSNYGYDLVWVAAPGEGIVTTYPFGTYAAGWGTSFSAPLVSGGAALLRNANSWCHDSCAQQAVAHAVPISAEVSNGRLDLYQAVGAANYNPDQQ